jgi:hypothetical protein
MSAWSWLKLRVCLWLLRMTFRVVRWLLLLAVVLAAWPVTLVGLLGFTVAWWRGWPAVRLYRAAGLALPVTAVWVTSTLVRVPGWRSAALALGRTWTRGLHRLGGTGLVHTFALLVPVALPAGLALAGLAWAWRTYALSAGIGGWTASAPVTFDARHWRRQVRTAKGLNQAPGAVPLLARGGRIPIGGTIRGVGHDWHPVFCLPAADCGRHMVVVGATGSGKTNLMIRMWAGWFTATLQAARAGRGHPPQLIVLDCKGGQDARSKADRTSRLLYGAGARRVAIWPDEARLCLWDLPAEDLAVLLYQMIDTGTGAAAYYADILQAVVDLAVLAPCGPPPNSAAFLDRLEVKWLQHAWGDGRHPAELARTRAAGRHLPDIQLRYATLLSRLGPALDGPGTLADADVWY